MFRFGLIALLTTFITATAVSASWVTRDLNLRAGPGTNHHVRLVLPRCAHVAVHRRSHGWYQITWRGHRGWVSGRHLAAHRPHYCVRGHHYRPHHHGYHHRPHRPHRLHRHY